MFNVAINKKKMRSLNPALYIHISDKISLYQRSLNPALYIKISDKISIFVTDLSI